MKLRIILNFQFCFYLLNGKINRLKTNHTWFIGGEGFVSGNMTGIRLRILCMLGQLYLGPWNLNLFNLNFKDVCLGLSSAKYVKQFGCKNLLLGGLERWISS